MTLRLRNRNEEIDNDEAVAFAVGHILGDGSMKATENRLFIEQKQLDYVKWKLNKCVKLGISNDVKVSELTRQRRDPVTGQMKSFTSYRFYTKSLFKDWHQFYVIKKPTDPTYNPLQTSRRRKCAPKQLKEWFKHPLALAVYYMDDGGVQHNQAYFTTGEFNLDEVQIVQACLLDNFSLHTSIRISNNVPKGVIVARRDCGKFLDLVQPYVEEVPCMHYKLNISQPDLNRKVRIYKPRND